MSFLETTLFSVMRTAKTARYYASINPWDQTPGKWRREARQKKHIT